MIDVFSFKSILLKSNVSLYAGFYIKYFSIKDVLFVFLELVEFSSIFLLNKNSRSKLINIIDKAALILLPVIFLVFNLWYWPYLLDPTHEDMDM